MAVDMSDVDFGKQGFGNRGRGRHTASAERGETGLVAGFERKVLFRIARFVAVTICFALFIAMVGGLVFMGSSLSGADKPDAVSLVQELKPAPAASSQGTQSRAPTYQEQATIGQQSPLVGLRVAPELQELMSKASNKRVLEGWVAELDVSDRQPLMDGLGQAAGEAKKHGVDVAAAINSYHEHFQAYLAEREVSKLASVEAKLYTAAAVISVLLLLALFSLVLVLLAIERNTYRTANAAYQE